MAIPKMMKFHPVEIVGEGLVAATGRGEGRFIPALILDVSHRPDIGELLRVHQHCLSGDAASVWARMPFSKADLALKLRFIKPMECEFVISFMPSRDALLIDAILHAQGFYFQAGRHGDKISAITEKIKILVEVPRSSFSATWEKRMPKLIAERFRAQGFRRQEARNAARELIASTRERLDMRLG